MIADHALIAALWRAERPDLDPESIALATMLKRIGDALEMETRAVSRATLSLGPGDARILLALRRNGIDTPMRPTELFRSLLITSGAVTKQVDRLERDGYVERRPDPAYKRGRLIALTEQGRATADAIMDRLFGRNEPLGSAFAALSPAEKAQGKVLVNRLVATMTEARFWPDAST